MPRPFSNYPYTDFHETNLDYILRLCRENLGIELRVIGNKLHLVNDLGESLSQVTISYAEKALTSNEGNDLDLFILSAGISGDKLAFTDGKGQTTTITVPYAIEASSDINGELITSYIKNVQTHNDYLRITKGDGTYYELTVPFATKASISSAGKNIDTFVATISTSGNDIVVKDNLNNEIARFEVQYAETANRDVDDDLIVSTYANSLVTGTSTVKLIAKDGTLLSEITVPFATAASQDNNGISFRSGYGNTITTGTSTVKLLAPDGTQLSEITVPFATVSTDATNAIETVSISGNNMIFTTYGGQSYSITCPYSVSALKDGLQNEIAETYVANITNDSQTGKITFYDAKGQILVELIPTVDKATHDSYNNLIADFVKQISVDPNSNYVTVTHGTGTTDSLVINYSSHAWKDTNDHVIKNFYIADLECVEDVNDGHYKLVAYDGDTPKAELFRIEITAYSAQTDINGVNLTSYIHDVAPITSGPDAGNIEITKGDGTTSNFTVPKATEADHATTADSATTASKDVNGNDLTSYVKNVSAIPLQSGGKLEITYGDNTTNQFVVPKSQESNYASTAASATLATTAHKDMNGHNLVDFVYYASPYSKHGIELFDANGNSKYQYDPIPDDALATSGDVLSTDAQGNLSWITPGGGIAPPEVAVGVKRKLIWSGEPKWELDMDLPFSYDSTLDTAPNASLWQQAYTMYTGIMQAGEVKHFSLILNCGDDFGSDWTFTLPFLKDAYGEGCTAKITKNNAYTTPQTGVTALSDLDLEFLYDVNNTRKLYIQNEAGTTTTANHAKIRQFVKLAIVYDTINDVFYRRIDYWLWNVSNITSDNNQTVYEITPSDLQWRISDESNIEWPSA